MIAAKTRFSNTARIASSRRVAQGDDAGWPDYRNWPKADFGGPAPINC